jgi:hypothetical protein
MRSDDEVYKITLKLIFTEPQTMNFRVESAMEAT